MDTQEILTRAILNDGLTFKLDMTSPKNGFMVSLQFTESTFNLDDVTPNDLLTFINDNKHFVNNDNANYYGIWIEKGLIYFDVSQNISDRTDAIYNGILRAQKAIYNLNDNVSIYLPTPQRAGTLTQQRAYAQITSTNL